MSYISLHIIHVLYILARLIEKKKVNDSVFLKICITNDSLKVVFFLALIISFLHCIF